MKLTTTPNTNRIATPANTITPAPPVDGNSDPVLFSTSMILSFSTVPSFETVHYASVVFVIVTLIGFVNLLNPSGALVSTNQ